MLMLSNRLLINSDVTGGSLVSVLLCVLLPALGSISETASSVGVKICDGSQWTLSGTTTVRDADLPLSHLVFLVGKPGAFPGECEQTVSYACPPATLVMARMQETNERSSTADCNDTGVPRWHPGLQPNPALASQLILADAALASHSRRASRPLFACLLTLSAAPLPGTSQPPEELGRVVPGSCTNTSHSSCRLRVITSS